MIGIESCGAVDVAAFSEVARREFNLSMASPVQQRHVLVARC